MKTFAAAILLLLIVVGLLRLGLDAWDQECDMHERLVVEFAK